ncbi:hypothetical protein TrLO_g11436 [Triparma laevis f. longispina]|uniref:RanBP2-type domain-containing protein n=1 Tax=Triparma laevis f. longispina TaxID=1714387 RepID=A0A9W6ZQ05_9STRA|nr:hypothetical protein TrLO_g11436 [Triparma laevis f. longispina]
MFGPSSTSVDVENATNFHSNAQGLSKTALTSSNFGQQASGNPFGSPSRSSVRKPLHDAGCTTPEGNGVGMRVTRSSSKKARTTPSSPSTLPKTRRNSLPNTSSNPLILPVNAPVTVTSGVHKSKTGSITTVSNSTYCVTFEDGSVSGNIPKGSILKSRGDGDGGVQRKITEFNNFEVVDLTGNGSGVADPTPKKRRRGQETGDGEKINGEVDNMIGNGNEKENSTNNAETTRPKSIFKSPAKIYEKRVNSTPRSTSTHRGDGGGGVRVNLYEPEVGGAGEEEDVVNDFKGLNIWDASSGSLNVKVRGKIEEWKSKYKVSAKKEEEEGKEWGEVDKLKKSNIDTGCSAAKWPKEEDIFEGSFSTVNPVTNNNTQGNENGHVPSDEEKSMKPGCWRCVMCLEENKVELVACGICKRLRARHNNSA